MRRNCPLSSKIRLLISLLHCRGVTCLLRDTIFPPQTSSLLRHPPPLPTKADFLGASVLDRRYAISSCCDDPNNHSPLISNGRYRRCQDREQSSILFQAKRNVATLDHERKNTKNQGNDDSSKSDRSMEDSRWQDAKFVTRNKYWVVLIDDEEPIRRAVGDYLYDSGYQVTACADASAFQELVHTLEESEPNSFRGESPKLPDAVVSDIRMPGMNGIALVEWIRQEERLKLVPVILLTAKGLTKDRIVGYRAGADAYLTKPFAPEELLGILDNAIRRRHQMKGETSALAELQQELAEIKQILKRNAANTVQKTDVYLTPAEREVLQLLSKGCTNTEIAAERGVATDRVIRTIQKLYVETGTKTRTELVRWAIQTGYVAKRY